MTYQHKIFPCFFCEITKHNFHYNKDLYFVEMIIVVWDPTKYTEKELYVYV